MENVEKNQEMADKPVVDAASTPEKHSSIHHIPSDSQQPQENSLTTPVVAGSLQLENNAIASPAHPAPTNAMSTTQNVAVNDRAELCAGDEQKVHQQQQQHSNTTQITSTDELEAQTGHGSASNIQSNPPAGGSPKISSVSVAARGVAAPLSPSSSPRKLSLREKVEQEQVEKVSRDLQKKKQRKCAACLHCFHLVKRRGLALCAIFGIFIAFLMIVVAILNARLRISQTKFQFDTGPSPTTVPGLTTAPTSVAAAPMPTEAHSDQSGPDSSGASGPYNSALPTFTPHNESQWTDENQPTTQNGTLKTHS